MTCTPPQLANRWQCTPETVLALIRRGALRAFTLSPPTAKRPRWRITEEAILEFEELHGPNLPTTGTRTQRESVKPADYVKYV